MVICPYTCLTSQSCPSAFPHKNIRLAAAEYTGTKAFFITLCSAHRRAFFADSVVALRLLQLLREEAEQHAFAIHAYCLMPNHLHFLAQGTQADCNRLRFVKAFRIRSSRGYAGQTWRVLWQKKYFDRVLRSGSALNSVAWYIWLNPVRKGLVDGVGKYPFAGSSMNAEPFRDQPADPWRPVGRQSRDCQPE